MASKTAPTAGSAPKIPNKSTTCWKPSTSSLVQIPPVSHKGPQTGLPKAISNAPQQLPSGSAGLMASTTAFTTSKS